MFWTAPTACDNNTHMDPSISDEKAPENARIGFGSEIQQMKTTEEISINNGLPHFHMSMNGGQSLSKFSIRNLMDSQDTKPNWRYERKVELENVKMIFICKICNRCFISSYRLKCHERVHTGERPFECHLCHKRFKQKSHLTMHNRSHTGEKPFQCPHCDKSFSQNAKLRQDILVHTGEKPYQCPHCDKSFSQNSNLRQHIRIHTGDRPYQCQHCDRSFCRKSSLQLHIRIYTEQGFQKCPHCDKSFCQKSTLWQHIHSIHTMESDSHSHKGTTIDNLNQVMEPRCSKLKLLQPIGIQPKPTLWKPYEL